MFHMLYIGCVYVYIYMVWHIDIVIVVSLHSFLCQYHGQGGISFPDAISSNIPKLSPILTIQKKHGWWNGYWITNKSPLPFPQHHGHRHKSTKWPNLVPQWSVTNTAFQVCHLEDVTRKMYFNNASIKKANKCVMDSKDSFLGKIIYGLGSNIATQKWPTTRRIPETNALRWYLKEILSIGPVPNQPSITLMWWTSSTEVQKPYVSKDHLIITCQPLGWNKMAFATPVASFPPKYSPNNGMDGWHVLIYFWGIQGSKLQH